MGREFKRIFPKKLICDKRVLGLLVLYTVYYSCGPKAKNTDHPAHFDQVIAKAVMICDSIGPFESLAYIDSAYNAFPNTGIGDKIRKYEHIRYCHSKMEKGYDTVMVYIDSILFVLQGHEKDEKYTLPHMKALLSKGDAYFALKRYDEAYPYYFKANLMSEKIDPESYSHLYSARLGFAYYKQARYTDALTCYKKALDMVTGSNAVHFKDEYFRLSQEQKYLNNIGLCYEKSEHYDSAIYSYIKALHTIDKYEVNNPGREKFTHTFKGVIYGNLGGTYYQEGNVSLAEDFLKLSIHINSKEGGDNRDAQTAQLKLAQLYINEKKAPLAHHVLQQLKLSLDSLPDEDRKLRWLYLQWGYYKLVGDNSNANRYLEKYALLRNNTDIRNQKKIGTDVNKQFQNIERQYEVELLKNENKLKSTYLWLAISLSVAGAIITLLLWRNWKQSRRNIVTLMDLNKQINAKNAELAQTSKDKDRMMKAMVHDLRNPMAGINSITSIMLDDKSLEGENLEMLQMIHKASLYSTEMIRDLVEATLQDHRETLRREKTDVYLLLKQCVNILRFKAGEKSQELELVASDNIIAPVDPEKIYRAVNNIITNAIKFSPAGTLIIISLEAEKDFLTLSVKDKGIGIPEDLKDKVFDTFTEAKRYGTANEKPYGLGLSISRQIVEAHGGSIWLESNGNDGTTFFIKLPLNVQ